MAYKSPIYLDHNATTPVDPLVFEAMTPYFRGEYGNPSSGYDLGRRAKEAVEQARGEVADLLGCKPTEIVFTSGGTESNNMVLKGLMDFHGLSRCHLITSAIEHPAILNPALFLMELGIKVTFLPVDGSCLVDPCDVEKAITSNTRLISVMLANNETGTLEPIKEIGAIAKAHGIALHTDAAQAIGKIPVDVNDVGLDFLTVAGHKLYAPKGVGALYIREGRSLTQLAHGAGQEGGRRAGTENVGFSVGLGVACRMAKTWIRHDGIRRMRDRLQELLFEGIEGLALNGHPGERLPNTLNVSVPGMEGAKILEALPGIMASTGAACHDRSVRLSHVLSAMNVPPVVGMGALRLTVGRSNTLDQIEEAARMIIQQVKRMRDERA